MYLGSTKWLLLTACFFAVCLSVKAQQQIPNGNFEQWENSGAQLEPVGWNGLISADLCTFCSFAASQRIFRDKNSMSKTGSCVRIESTSSVGVTVNGTITTGRIIAGSVIPSNGYNQTVRKDPSFNLPFTDKPDSIVFWARYSIADGSDSALVSFLIHDDFEQTDPPRKDTKLQALGTARMVFQTNQKWKRISVPFRYAANASKRSMFMLATFSASFIAGKGNSNSVLWIDDVELIYNSPSEALVTRSQTKTNR